MTCEWGYTDCVNQDKKCDLCFSEGFHYEAPKQKKRPQLNHRQQKADKRMGASFEFKNHQNNQELLQATGSRMTPNSGAWIVKGDEEISGLLTAMEELKTKVTKQAPGKESFTIKKEWLQKLNREAREANKEFYYLKFSFHEYDPDVYIIIEQEMIMSMIVTMVEDRRKTQKYDLKEEVYRNRISVLEAEIVKLSAEKDLLVSENKLLRIDLDEKDDS